MTQGRRRLAWDCTSHVLAMLYNANKNTDAPIKQPRDFNPVSQETIVRRPRKRVMAKDLSILKEVFVDNRHLTYERK